MKFRNVKVPEGINVSRHNPFADLFILTGGVLAFLAVLALGLYFLGGSLARYMPVAWENALANAVLDERPSYDDEAAAAVGAELQELADRLAARMDLPDGLQVTLHYLDGETVNAFATIGGHLFVYRGLLERMPSENALAMVLAHEIAHAQHRDAWAALGGTAILQLAMTAVLGGTGGSLADILEHPGVLVRLGFSREAERRADATALAALAAYYGHVADAGRLFQYLRDETAKSATAEPPALWSTHPFSDARIAAIAEQARANGWPVDGPLRPLPPAIAALAQQ